jgi:DUF1365 family protein
MDQSVINILAQWAHSNDAPENEKWVFVMSVITKLSENYRFEINHLEHCVMITIQTHERRRVGEVQRRSAILAYVDAAFAAVTHDNLLKSLAK